MGIYGAFAFLKATDHLRISYNVHLEWRPIYGYFYFLVYTQSVTMLNYMYRLSKSMYASQFTWQKVLIDLKKVLIFKKQMVCT